MSKQNSNENFTLEVQKPQSNMPDINGWRLFIKEKPLDDQRYYYSQGNQFFKGIWSDKLKGFLLDDCEYRYISHTCDYFHVCH